MQAYATTELSPLSDQLRTFDRSTPVPDPQSLTGVGIPPDLIDQVLGRLADLVVDRLIQRNTASTAEDTGEWLDARGAADYLGMHRDTLRKLAAQHAVPAHQDGPRCKLYFRKDELDEWRRSAGPTSTSAAARLRAVS
jgi:excisionase family DNA binding protein